MFVADRGRSRSGALVLALAIAAAGGCVSVERAAVDDPTGSGPAPEPVSDGDGDAADPAPVPDVPSEPAAGEDDEGAGADPDPPGDAEEETSEVASPDAGVEEPEVAAGDAGDPEPDEVAVEPDDLSDAPPSPDPDPSPVPEPEACAPKCAGKTCGPDGCGGMCGTCPEGTCLLGICHVPGSGSLTCEEVSACLVACLPGDFGCSAVCLAEGSPEGAAEAKAAAICAVEHGCGDGKEGLLCTADACAAEIAACYAGGEGELGCGDVLSCVATCPESPPSEKEACFHGCIDDGTTSAQTAFAALSLCLEAFCPQGSSEACAVTAFGDPKQCAGYAALCNSDGCGKVCPAVLPYCIDGQCSDGGPPGACKTANDLDIVYGGEIDVWSSAAECTFGCLAEPVPQSCAIPCVVEGTGLGAPCASCWVEEVVCLAAMGCIEPCSKSENDCVACLVEKGCLQAFYTCSGLKP